MMPKLGTSLAATTPALVKFCAKFLDKGVKLEREWVRTQEYAPVLAGAIGFGMMYTDTYPDMARSIWDGSIGIFSDQVLGQFFKLIDPPANSEAAARKRAAEAQRRASEQARKQLPPGSPGAPDYSRERAASVLEF